MIQVDISNIWGEFSLPDLLAVEKDIAQAHELLTTGTGEGNRQLGWLNLPTRKPNPEIQRLTAAAQKIRDNSDALVVVGIGGSCLGARAAIELLQGAERNLCRTPQIFFAGNSLSTRRWQELCRLLEDKDFSIVIISKSGSTLESGIAARSLRWMLERRYGTDGARERIYAITDPCKGGLRQTAEDQGWETFSIPPSVGGRFSVLSPAGLLPMAVAGIDIQGVLKGAMDAKDNLDLRSFDNPAWLYAGVRSMMYRRGKQLELLESFEPGFSSFGAWWQQLFGQSEGKDGKGLFPVYAELPASLHSLGQMIQQGQRNLFETVVRFDAPWLKTAILPDYKNLDGLNYLSGQTLDFVEEQAFRSVLDSHTDGGVPVVSVDCGALEEQALGELFYFMELSCCLSAYALGVNPFNQPGLAIYKNNLLGLLGKPGYEKIF